MKRSRVSLGSAAFWENDNLLELWFLALAGSIAARGDATPWLERVGATLAAVAVRGLDGSELALDDLELGAEQLGELVAATGATLVALRSGDGLEAAPVVAWARKQVSATSVAALLESEGETTRGNVLATGEAFLALLEGRLPEDAAGNESALMWPARS